MSERQEGPERLADGFYWVGGPDSWLMLFLDEDGMWWSADMPVSIDPEDSLVAVPSASGLATLLAEKQALEAERDAWLRCAIGDDPLPAESRAEKAEAERDRLVKAGDFLSLCAQTTGGTPGPDEALMEAIKRWETARTALRTETGGE